MIMSSKWMVKLKLQISLMHKKLLFDRLSSRFILKNGKMNFVDKFPSNNKANVWETQRMVDFSIEQMSETFIGLFSPYSD